MKTKTYRNNGAIGALLDEYEKSIQELYNLIGNVTDTELIEIADPVTKDPDCVSIQTILTHVLRAGYNYVVEIRRWLGEEVDFKTILLLNNSKEYQKALLKMFSYSEQLFSDYPKISLVEKDNEKKILVRWKQQYDVDQLMEHAIVHMLRHRRQIERFLLKLRTV